jgi:hypothetical protein
MASSAHLIKLFFFLRTLYYYAQTVVPEQKITKAPNYQATHNMILSLTQIFNIVFGVKRTWIEWVM